MAYERLSNDDLTLMASYSEHLQRYEFALSYCKDKRVLDAGCGIGYGAYYLAINGAASVTAIDISEEALTEAGKSYRHPNLKFEKYDVEKLDSHPGMQGAFDVVVNFENLEHVPHPDRLIKGVAKILSVEGGKYITSTPNGAISLRDSNGKPINKFHVEEYTVEQLRSMLTANFSSLSLYGQWLTYSGKLRKLRARELFDDLCESYYNPMSRIGRVIKRLYGGKIKEAPKFTAGQDHFPGDHAIDLFDQCVLPWAPEVIIAVCEKPKIGDN